MDGLFLELFFFKAFMVDGYLRESPTKCTYISETHRPETGNQYCCLCFFTSLHKTLCLHLIETIHIHTHTRHTIIYSFVQWLYNLHTVKSMSSKYHILYSIY